MDRFNGCHLTAQMLQDPLRGHLEWTLKGAAAGIFVATAPKPLRDGSHVHPPLAAQAEAYMVVPEFAQKNSNFGEWNRVRQAIDGA